MIHVLNKKIQRFSSVVLNISALLFLFLFLIIIYNNRLASDDIVFLAMAKGQHPLVYLSSIYNSWSGRWASSISFYAVSCLVTLQSAHLYIFIYYCCTLLLLIYSVNSLLRFSLQKTRLILPDQKTTILYSVFFIASFYYFTFACSEAWWWFCASFSTLQGIVLLLCGCALVIKKKKKNIHYFLICISFVYVGGCYEIYALIIETLVLLLILYAFIMKKYNFVKFKRNMLFKGIVVAAASLLVSSAFCFSAPGNQHRRIAESENYAAGKQMTASDGKREKDFQNFKRSAVALGISALWFIFGNKIKSNQHQKKQLPKLLLASFIPLVVSIIVTLLFQALVLRGYSLPLRAWTFTSFSLALCSCSLFFIVGLFFNSRGNFSVLLSSIIFSGCIAFVLAVNLIDQYRYVTTYSTTYDKLIGSLVTASLHGEIKTLEVNKLPEPGVLIPLNISDDYIKVPLKEILNLKCDIKVKD